MATTRTIRRPAWQTEELAEEWVEPDDNASDAAPSVLSLGSPVGFGDDDREVEGNEEKREVERRPAGTFLVREDVPATPLLAKTPGHNKNAIKDFFTPLPLEQMFQPVSSPPVDSNYAYQPGATHHLDPLQRDESSASGSDTDGSEHRDSMAEHHPNHPPQCEFTFSVPRRSILSSSTPHPQGLLDLARRGLLPATDPRLRLFHFQYDTFTRDHLSQLVDSIAANTPSGSSGGEPSPAVNGTFARMATQLSRVSEASSSSSPSRLRSIKRIKLSPPTEYGDGDGAGAKFRRPRSRSRRDYNRESKSVMQQIKQARHFSKVFTRPDELSPLSGIIESQRDGVVAERSSQQAIPSVTTALLKVSKGNGGEQPPGGVDTNPQKSNPSFLDYRMQAVDLMAQIRTDVQEQGRLFSGDTMVSHVAAALSHSAARQSLSSSQRTALAQTQAHSKGSSAEQTEPVQIRSPARKDHLSSSTDARRSLKNRSPRKLCRVGSDGSLPGKPPFEVPAVAVFTAFPASNGANPAPFPISDGFLAPTHIAGYPSSSLRLRVSEDLNRLVSSSTASGTTLTAGSSAGSYSKHAGPPHMTRIAPEDMPALPDRVGKMVFDKELMKWVKDTAKATSFHADDPQARDQTSEDPFRDIESLKDEDSSRSRRSRRLSAQSQRTSEMSRITEVEESELEDEEERELASFSMGDHPSRVVPAMADGTDSEGEDEGYDEAIASGEESEEEVADVVEMSAAMSIDDLAPSSSILPQVVAPSAKPRVTPAKVHASPRGRKFTPYVFGTPVFPSRPSSSLAPTPLRSALKSGGATPNKTPANHPAWRRRSVSFSDGKREGQIRGLSKNSGTLSAPEADGSNAMSPRTRRIAKMMAQLEGTSYEEESPSKVTARPPAEEIQPFSLQATPANSTSASADGRNSSRSASVRSTKSFQKGNATFLTECSFGVAHDRLVQVITDVQPFEPHWEQLGAIDLSNKNLDSVARLKEFLPRLDSLCLDRNQVSYLSGIPSTVRSLSAASNVLTSVTSFNHLRNLENLDISGNDVDSLRQLECLRHLRELRADGNKVASVDGLEKLDGLVKLSLEGNAIGDVQLEKCRWRRLEMLNLRSNRIETITGLESLPSLQLLNLENNQLRELDPSRPLPRLRILRVSGNRLHELHARGFPHLRTLYADDNYLDGLVKVGGMTKLENLSLRNQRGRLLNVSVRNVRDVKRLYLSGNPLKAGFLDEPCYNLTYLELAGCRLASLPTNMAKLVPNLRILNLNYNFLEDVRPLHGLARLRKLTVIGSRLKGAKDVIRVLRGMPEAEIVDFRMNPCTLAWYVPLLYRKGSGGARGESEWAGMDGEFRRGLPTEVYTQRMLYRGQVMRVCGGLRELDGLQVLQKERDKAAMLLAGARQGPGR